MKIGNDSNFIEILPAPSAAGQKVYSVRVHISDSRSECTLRNDAVVFDLSEAVRLALVVFESLVQHTFRFAVAGDGFVEISRENKDTMMVSYRIPTFERNGFLEGKVAVRGDYSFNIVREIRKLFG